MAGRWPTNVIFGGNDAPGELRSHHTLFVPLFWLHLFSRACRIDQRKSTPPVRAGLKLNMKCKACIKLQSLLAFTVFGCECASLASSFVTFNKNDVVVKNNFPAIRQSFSSIRPFSLDMTDDKDYVSPMRQREPIPPPFTSRLLRLVLIIIRRFDSVVRTASQGRRCRIHQREYTASNEILQ